jgi:CRP-like cAMP-binding protein
VEESYENKIAEGYDLGKELPDRLDISILKYLWQASLFNPSKKNNIPRFLRNLSVLNNFSDYELKVLSSYLHHRKFSDGEVIFNQGDVGVGFYFLYSGSADVVVENNQYVNFTGQAEDLDQKIIVTLEQYEYFGELALLRDNSLRSASAKAKGACELLGIIKPDLEELIKDHPVVATKFLQSISVIIANRLYSITREVTRLKSKIVQLENNTSNNIGPKNE